MKLAMLNLTGGGMSGGHRKYLSGMLPFLAASGKVDSILCASPQTAFSRDSLGAVPNISFADCEPFRPFFHSPGPRLKAALDSFSPDILFIPVERYVNYRDLPVVIMLQNMAPLAHVRTGSGFMEFLTAALRRYETRYALRRAAAVIVPTEHVRDFLVRNTGIAPEKVTVINYGVTPPGPATEIPASFPFPGGKFILSAGSLEMYRGLEDLIRALPAVKAEFPGIKLAIAGGTRPSTEGYLKSLRFLASSLGVDREIAWLGNVPEPELSWYYSNCEVLALTSRVESFCFVALEAMQHGCRIVSSDSPCLPEVLRDAALYYRPGDADALAANILQLLRQPPPEAEGVRRRAFENSARFRWDVAGAATLSVLERFS